MARSLSASISSRDPISGVPTRQPAAGAGGAIPSSQPWSGRRRVAISSRSSSGRTYLRSSEPMSDGIPSRLLRTEPRQDDVMASARLQNDVSGSETAYDKWTNKETVRPPSRNALVCLSRPSPNRTILARTTRPAPATRWARPRVHQRPEPRGQESPAHRSRRCPGVRRRRVRKTIRAPRPCRAH